MKKLFTILLLCSCNYQGFKVCEDILEGEGKILEKVEQDIIQGTCCPACPNDQPGKDIANKKF